MNNQGQPYAYLTRPHWERDDVKVFPDIQSLVTRCDDGQTFTGPGSVRVMAVYPDGRELEVPREVYSVPDPVSREKAEEFVRRRSDPAFGCLRSNPDLSFEDQVAKFIETSPWRWKSVKELASPDAVSHGGKPL